MDGYKIKFNVLERIVPDDTVQKWQNIVNSLADIFQVPAGLIMKVSQKQIEVLVSSETKGNPYKVGASEHLHGKLYCETVMNEDSMLYVDDALQHEKWKNNPDVPLNMISYLGIPLHWPTGETFGTICVLDSKPIRSQKDNPVYKDLLWSFKTIIEDQLKLLFEIEKRKRVEKELERINKTLESRVKKRTQELNKTIERLKLATIASNIGIWDWNINNNHLIWDESMYRLYGISQKDSKVAYKAWLDILHPEDKTRIKGEIQAALRGEKEYAPEFRVILPDGSIRFIKAVSRTFLDNNGEPVRIIGTNVDITDFKHNEDRLKENETKLRALFDEAGYAIGVSKSGRTYMVNQAYLKLFGFRDDSELIGSPLIDQIAPSERAWIRSLAINRSMGKPTPTLYETKGLTKDGTVFDMDVRVSTYQHNEEIFSVGIMRDITERNKIEQALRDNEEKYRALFENAGDAIFIADVETETIIDANKMAEKLLGLPRSEIIGKNRIILHPDTDQYTDKFINHVNIGQVSDIESVVIDQSGQVIPVRISATVLEIGGRKVLQGIFRDITERKRAEEEIKKNLSEKEILLRELYHRTKNNMQIISSMLRLKSRTIKNKELESAFTDIENKIQCMSLVHQKLYESKDLSHINLEDFIKSLVSLIKQCFLEIMRNLTIEINIKGADVLIDTAIPIGLVINELLTNSIKHAFPDKRRGKIQISMHINTKNVLVLEIADNGIGLPKDFDFEKDIHLGLQTVIDLVRDQLEGNIKFINGNGLCCRMSFSKEMYEPRI